MPRTRRAISCRRSGASFAIAHRKGRGLRVDSGVFEGAEITLHYDPMIAKLIAYGADRDSAIDRLRQALDGFYIAGVRHNIAFLAAVAASERFRAGRLSTDFIAENFPGGFAPPTGFVAADRVILIAAALAETRLHETEIAPDGADAGSTADAARPLTVLLDGRPYPVSVRPEGSAYIVERGRELSRGDRLARRAPIAASAHRRPQRDRADRNAARARLPAGAWRRGAPRPGAVAARRRAAVGDARRSSRPTPRAWCCRRCRGC